MTDNIITEENLSILQNCLKKLNLYTTGGKIKTLQISNKQNYMKILEGLDLKKIKMKM
jgi:hypothetical protein